MTNTMYIKKGRRYIPIGEYEALSYTPLGWWLVHVQPGQTSARKMVNPALVETEAAMKMAQEAMTDAMQKRTIPSGPSTKHVPEQDRVKYQLAWEAWKSHVGDVPLYFEGVSMHDVVDAGIEALRQKIKEQATTIPFDVGQAS